MLWLECYGVRLRGESCEKRSRSSQLLYSHIHEKKWKEYITMMLFAWDNIGSWPSSPAVGGLLQELAHH